MTTIDFDTKEAELKSQFTNEQTEAAQIEEKIKELQTRLQEKIVNMTRLQGGFSLLNDMRKESEMVGVEVVEIDKSEDKSEGVKE